MRYGLSRARALQVQKEHYELETLENRSLLDGLPVVSLMQIDKFASEEGEDVARFGVKRTGSLAEPLTVFYTIAGTATQNEDYVGLSGVIRIPAGKDRASLPVIPIDDFDVEGNETVRITLIAPGGAKYALNYSDNVSENMVITITETDVVPTVLLRMPDRVATEYGPNNGLIVVTRDGPLELPLSVNLKIAGSATPGSLATGGDYIPIPTTINFAPGVSRYEIEIDALNDNLLEGDEMVRVTILDADAYDLDLSAKRNWTNTVKIIDRPAVSMLVIDPTATTEEGDDGAILLHRTGPLDTELRVKLVISGSAIEGRDYVDLPRTIIFAPGESMARIDIVGLGTRFTDAFRTIRLDLAAGPQYNINPGASFGEIKLFDEAFTPTV